MSEGGSVPFYVFSLIMAVISTFTPRFILFLA